MSPVQLFPNQYDRITLGNVRAFSLSSNECTVVLPKNMMLFYNQKKNALGLSSLDQSHHLLFLLLLFFFLSFFPFFLHIISKGHPNTYHVLYTKVLHVLYVWLVFAFGKIHTHSSSLNQHKGLSEIHRAWSDSSRCKVCSFSF